MDYNDVVFDLAEEFHEVYIEVKPKMDGAGNVIGIAAIWDGKEEFAPADESIEDCLVERLRDLIHDKAMEALAEDEARREDARESRREVPIWSPMHR